MGVKRKLPKPLDALDNAGITKHLDFSSNDYLGLTKDSRLIEAATCALEAHGMGSTGSRLLSGNRHVFLDLEQEVARFKNKPSCLIFNSGYQMNEGVMRHLVSNQDAMFLDKFVHASIVDGAYHSQAKIFRFKHNSLEHLTQLLDKNRSHYNQAWISVESLYSMDGDTAPLPELIDVAKHYSAKLYVDEAHAIGMFGDQGEGLISADMAPQIDVIVGTFGKALGSSGGFITCSEELKTHLINECRSFIYSTALPVPVIAWNLKAIQLLPQLEPVRRKVLSLVSLAAKQLKQPWASPICPFVLGEESITLSKAKQLETLGIRTLPIRQPTVPKGQCRLRISITAHHDKSDINRLCQALEP